MKKNLQMLLLCLAIFCFCFETNAQCVSGSVGGNGNLMNTGGNSYSIACDGGNVNISGSSSVTGASNIQWTSGQTGNFTFSPDCNNLGCQEFTPCIPAGTNVGQQCATFGSLGVPSSGSGNNFSLGFNIAGFCYVPGMTYSGNLGINLSGSGNVSLSVVQPDGVVQGPLTFDIDLINSLSPVPLSLLNLNVDPNGTWSIDISGGGLTGYSIDANSNICLEALTTSGVVCGDPIEICVFGGCPSFVSAQASETDVCSGGSYTLSAELSPTDAPNVTYLWSGNGITAANQNSASPTVSVSNTTCSPVTETYTLDVTCTNDGSSVVTGQTVSVTVYPEIDGSQAVIDNTSNVNDPNCSIAVTYPPCPGFSITGNTSFIPGDNGTNTDFVISNGNSDCDVTVSSVVNCIGSCNPPNATVTTNCSGGNYIVNVTINSMGDSQSADIVLSDGTVQNYPATSVPATFTFGIYPSGSPINVKILDSIDPSCSINLGLFDGNCFNCPNLTTLGAVATDVCGGDVINLVANVDQGTEGIDYAVQWFENGVAINGGNAANYAYTAVATDRCNAASNTYMAVLTCLNGGGSSTTTSLSTGPVNVYPVPVEGIDFVFENCSVTPIDNCGTLTINTGGASNPSPGGSTNVNYTITVGSAPAACAATGTTTVDCSSCVDYPGNGNASETVLCWGESFNFSNTSALVSSLGYEVGYVITPNPPSSYTSTAAMLAASIGGPQGPYPAPGSIPATTYTNDGSLINPSASCGELLYFTPFVSFACQSYTAENSSGTVETPAGSDFIAGVYQTPGIGGVTLAVPQVPYCPGLVTYNIELCVDDQTDDGAGFFGLCFAGEDPLQQSSLFGLIGGLPGGGFSNFPNINNVHDSQQNVCYNQNGWTANASGELINIVTVNLQDFCAGGNNNDFMGWGFQVDVNCNSSFPTLCPDCDVLGAPVAVRFLPQTSLGSITAGTYCEGEMLDLTTLNPTTNNPNGIFNWYEGPSTNGQIIGNPTNVVLPVGVTQYCATYTFCDTGDCVEETCVNIVADPLPTLAAFTLGPICSGESFDLSSVEGSIVPSAGAVQWSIGSASGATIANPTSVTPVGSEQYCATYTDNGTGCSNTICSAFTYNPLPVLLSAAPIICANQSLQLASLNSSITTASGTFVWYAAAPGPGVSPIGNTLVSGIANGTNYWVEFTESGAGGCSAIAQITVTVNPLPVLNPPSVTLCQGEALDLTSLEASVITSAGTFAWYNGNPTTTGLPVGNAMNVVPVAGDTYCVEFTDGVNNCTDFVCFSPTVNPLPTATTYTPQPYCAGSGPYDLTQEEAAISPGNTFVWYTADPATGAAPITNASAVAIADGASMPFWYILSDPATGCGDTLSVNLSVYTPISGIVASYDCGTNQIVVDFTNATGGAGSGYGIAASSPNMPGDVIPDNGSWTIIITDSVCDQFLITDVNDCNACQAIAPSVSYGGPSCGNGTTGAPIFVLDGMDGSTNAGELTEYILTTMPNDTIRLVGSLADMQMYVDTMSLGTSACIQAITYTQLELDQIVVDLDVCTNGLATSLIGLSLTGNTLQGVISAIQNFSPGAAFTLIDIETLIGGGGGGPGFGGSVDIGVLLGLPPGSLVCALPEFCYNIATQACVTVGSCGCNAVASTVSIGGTNCGNGTFAAPFVVTDNGDGSSNVGELTEYILSTAPNDTIQLVGNLAAMNTYLDALAPNSTVCIQSITYSQAELDQIVVDLDVCTNGLASGLIGLPLSGNTVEGVLTAITNFSPGATFTITDVETLIGGSGGGPGTGGSVDLGVLLGLPPGSLVCALPPICYKIGGQTCVTTGSCCVPQTCDDNNPCTINDMLDANCICAGTFLDTDNDGICDLNDICPGFDDSIDTDLDTVPDGCDICPNAINDDSDGDGVCDNVDACPGFDDNVDSDGDNIADGCDICPNAFGNDSDGDGICDDVDVCPGFDDLVDTDGDNIPNGCDACPNSATGDSDGDGVCDNVDICPGGNDAVDTDGDNVPNFCDACPNSATGDSDGDGVCDDVDICPGGNDAIDTDMDGTPNACDPCPNAASDDSDGDGVCDNLDICPGFDDTQDTDLDGTPDACDACPNSNTGDTDGDGICDDVDICGAGDDQIDTDNDGIPDACDSCPNLNSALIGTACTDGDPCTINDVYLANCNCVGTYVDSDNDGTCDANDLCPGGPEPGTPCDDGNANTSNDFIDGNCTCSGQATGSSCTLEIPMQAGWNLISSYCVPTNPAMEAVFVNIASNTIQVKDLTNTYVPSFNFNSIGNWDITSGYQVKMLTADTLVINGTWVDPLATPITLNQGWNLISYLLPTQSGPFSMYNSINPNMIQMKDLTGTFIPSFNFNDMGDAIPTRGYQVKMITNDVFIYDPANIGNP